MRTFFATVLSMGLSLFSDPISHQENVFPIEVKVDLFRFISATSSLATHYEKETFFNTGFVKEHTPRDRSFWGADFKLQIPLANKNAFSKFRFFSSKRKYPLIDYSGYLDSDAVALHYDLQRSYTTKNILVTTAQNGYLFNEDLVETLLGFKILVGKHLAVSLTQGVRFSHLKHSISKKIGFLYLKNAPIEELRNFDSFTSFQGGGPVLGAYINYTPFPNNFLSKTLHFFSQIDTCLDYGKINVMNQFSVDNGGKKFLLIEQNNTSLHLIPVFSFLLGFEFRPDFIFFQGSIDFMVYNQTWLNADRSYQGTLDFKGPKNLSLTGYAIGAGFNF